MTVSVQISEDSYTADGAATPRSIGFQLIDPTHLTVEVDGVAQILGVDYSISGDYAAGSGTIQPITLWDAGAEVRYYRATPSVQQYDVDAGVALKSVSLEQELDRQALRSQEHGAAIGRALLVPRGESGYVLLKKALRANLYPVFDPNGDLIYSQGTGADAGLRGDLGSSGGAALIKAAPFSGFTIPDGSDGQEILQALETAVEARGYIIATFDDIATADNIPAAVTHFRTLGRSTVGDGGGAYYTEGAAGAPGGATSADGRHWELKDPYLWLKSFGATLDGAADDVSAMTVAASKNADFTLVGKLLRTTTVQVPNSFAFGHLPSLLRGRNIVTNGNFNTWQRFDAKSLSSLAYSPPTFGNASTYEGTGGLRVTSADLWRAQVFGLFGSGTITRGMLSATETALGDGSEFYARWAATSVTPPASTETTITNMTSPASSPVTITAAGHGLSNSDYIYIENSTYTGGNGTLNGTYQVSNVSGDNFDITVTPDAGFSAWTSFGNLTNDPDNVGFEHLYDAAISLWVRNGTASHVFQYRAPQTRFPGGLWTVRLRMKRISGSPLIRARLYYDFGSGGTPSTSTSTVALLANPTSGTDVIDYVGVVDIGSLSGKTFGTSRNTGYMAVSLEADATDFDVVLYSVSARPGVGSLPNDGWTRQEAWPVHQLYYRTLVAGRTDKLASGEYSGAVVALNPPMPGTPTINKLSDLALSAEINAPVIDQITFERFRIVAQANAAVTIGQWMTRVEVIYEIPT